MFASSTEKRAYLLERLGKPLADLGYEPERQMAVICETLKKTWEVPAKELPLSDGKGTIAWFREHIGGLRDRLEAPCGERVLHQAMEFLRDRELHSDPAGYVLVHGDAHAANTLQSLSAPGVFKFIDPDGIYYEKAYDLGVLMREWREEYRSAPLKRGRERCALLHWLTGVEEGPIWQWGFLQMVSTALILLQIGQEKTAREMLRIAEAWCE